MIDINPNFSTLRQIMRQNLKLVPTNPEGIVTIEAPPPGFDPRTAALSDLMKYGIPPRPDPAVFPEGAAIWDRILSRTHQIIVPDLRVRPEIKRSLSRPPPSGKATDASENWSGGVLLKGGPFSFVYGEWTVPGVAPPGWPESLPGRGRLVVGGLGRDRRLEFGGCSPGGDRTARHPEEMESHHRIRLV
jgi:hypothetical protein